MQHTSMKYEPVIGVEVHAELQTASKMFCACPVVDSTSAAPNSAVCPVCAGMPGVLPVVNGRAVEFGLRVALALGCEINYTSLFARKNYFYPDLPKGYQISQYELPLACRGRLAIFIPGEGGALIERQIRIRRVHLEEDTGKLTHVGRDGGQTEYSLIDLNRAGVPLLEIVTEPDLHSAEEVSVYAETLRSLLRYLEVNSGDMQKGILRIEPNISVRPAGSKAFGTRTEIKNLNSFRALERSTAYEIERQIALLERGEKVKQETRGWDEGRNLTFTQRVKEGEDDYRYFPEPDLPPLALQPEWVESVRSALPELPNARLGRFQAQYGLSAYDAGVLTAEKSGADYYEAAVAASEAAPKMVANWVTGELFSLLNEAGQGIEASPVSPAALAALLRMVAAGEINQNTGKTVLSEMFTTGKPAAEIVAERGLRQVSDSALIAGLVEQALAENPEQVAAYLAGKESLSRWLFGQVMRLAKGQANPQVLQRELEQQLEGLKLKKSG
jgi:aspartyl-tRNA(Asn)/glutamyl-tRNA(Gln) amidotransferase subunit B